MRADSHYRHTQSGKVIIYSMGLSILLILAVWYWTYLAGERETVADVILGAIVAVLLVVMWLLGSLTVVVSRDELEFWMGPGISRVKVPMKDIRSAKVVRNPWYYGWGIHLTPDGWLYNVSGIHAVEVEYVEGKGKGEIKGRDKGRARVEKRKKLRVGTDQPEELEAAIRLYLKGK